MLPNCEAWKVDTVGVYDANIGRYRQRKDKFSRRKGVPDIIGFYKKKFFALEVKTPKTKTRVTDEQRFFIETAKENAQIAEVVWSIDQVKEILKCL